MHNSYSALLYLLKMRKACSCRHLLNDIRNSHTNVLFDTKLIPLPSGTSTTQGRDHQADWTCITGKEDSTWKTCKDFDVAMIVDFPKRILFDVMSENKLHDPC